MRDVTKLMASRITLGQLSTALALLSGGGWAGAQTVAANAGGSSDTALETIVVTAQRRAEDIQTVPISIQAFTGKALEELGFKSSSDIPQFTSNVEIALPSGAGTQPLISTRGIGINDYETYN